MNKKLQRLLWVAGIAGSLSLCGLASAQSTPFQPFKNLFGPKAPPEKSAEQKTQEANRATEVQVELAWLSNRTTFPYYLEAHIKGTNLEVRGYVPNKSVREEAINLAKLNCSLNVTDAMKEHSSLAFRSSARPPEQLKSSVVSSFRETPEFSGLKLTVQCQADGNVQIAGNVKTLEQKLAVSKSLRRLYGCTYVTNNTVTTSGEPSQPPVLTARSTTSAMPINTSAATGPMGVTPVQPYESRGVVVVSGQETKAGPTQGVMPAQNLVPQSPVPSTMPASNGPTGKASVPATTAGAAIIKRKIETSVPNVHNVTVAFTSKTEVKIECTLRSGEDFDTVAGQISGLRELEGLAPDLRITLPMTDHK